MTMKNQRTFWERMKNYSKRLATTSLLAGTLVLQWHTAEAEPLSVVELNCAEYSVLTIGALDDEYPSGVARIICRMSVYSLQADAFTPTFLHQPPPDSISTYEPEFAVDDAGFLEVFSW